MLPPEGIQVPQLYPAIFPVSSFAYAQIFVDVANISDLHNTFTSRMLQDSESRYPVHDLENLDLVESFVV